mmetsp:Transcript_10254/g.9309  ORF Transcript_10254/g.9309 Transcript_10254/m.9309 type:complete len:97 (-) Transcript_10254:3-293(-)
MFCACGLCGAIWAVLQIVSGVGLVSFLKVVVEYCGPHGETKKSGGPFECEDVTKDWSDAQYDDAKHLVDIAISGPLTFSPYTKIELRGYPWSPLVL